MLPLPGLPNARLALVLMLMLLVVLSGCCAMNSTLSAPEVVEAPKIPVPPPMLEPVPSESYLLRAQKNIEGWQLKLKGILATP